MVEKLFEEKQEVILSSLFPFLLLMSQVDTVYFFICVYVREWEVK